LQSESALVQFSERLTNSAAFGTLFREGMDLVEQTAPISMVTAAAKQGARTFRQSHLCDRKHAADHTADAACILAVLHRAVKEGEMTLSQANREKTKVKLSAADPGPEDMIAKLPQQLQDLISRSMNLHRGCAGSMSRSMRRRPNARRSAIRWCRSSTG